MTGVVSALLSFLLLYKYFALFAIVFVSALILPFPVGTVLLATGAFASQGYFNLWATLSTALSANILGDIAGYILGIKYGRGVLRMLHVRLPASFDSLEEKMRRHAVITIIITRFSGSLDVVGNFLSGFICLPFLTFFLSDVLGNIISIGPLVYGGYVAGGYWQEYSTLVDTIGGIVFVFSLIVILFLFFIRKAHRQQK